MSIIGDENYCNFNVKNRHKIFRFFIPVVFYASEGGWVRQNTTVVGTAPFKRTRKRKTSIDSHISVSKHKQIFSMPS
jgi:hypothetical protein